MKMKDVLGSHSGEGEAIQRLTTQEFSIPPRLREPAEEAQGPG